MTQALKVNVQFSAVPTEKGIMVHPSYSIVEPGQDENTADRYSFTGGESILVSLDDARAKLALALGAPEANSDQLNTETWAKVGQPAQKLLMDAALAMHGADKMVADAAVHLAAAHLITLAMQNAPASTEGKGQADA